MPKSKPNREVEIKLRVSDASALRHRLKQLRARELLPRTYKSNNLYDSPSRNLTRRGQLMRIRIEQPSANARNIRAPRTSSAILTYKGPSRSFRGSQTTPRKRNGSTRFKV